MQATHAKGHADAAQAEIEVHTRKHADASLKTASRGNARVSSRASVQRVQGVGIDVTHYPYSESTGRDTNLNVGAIGHAPNLCADGKQGEERSCAVGMFHGIRTNYRISGLDGKPGLCWHVPFPAVGRAGYGLIAIVRR